MTSSDDFLNRLAPAHAWVPDWPDVLDRAGVGRPTRIVAKRRLLIALAVVVAVLVPLVALAGANDWWFLGSGGPTPTKAPVVVKEGVWQGRGWQLVAYPSTTDGLCIAVDPKSTRDNGAGAALECGPFAGIARASSTKASPDMAITFLNGSASKDLPAYIAGPVIERASTVEIRFGNGTVLRVPTFAGPGSLRHVRFYATALPANAQTLMRPHSPPSVKWVAGLDTSGNVVACLAPLTAKDGISPLSACR